MPSISSFKPFNGDAPYTSTIAHILQEQGVKNPLTGKPFSEAFMFGISGGAAFGYFNFSYEGHDPQVNLITRNTFNNYGWDSICERLSIPQDVIQSTSEAKSSQKLRDVLEEGLVPAVWADMFTIGYEHSELGEGMWAMQPVVVGSFPGESESDEEPVSFSDRSSVIHNCSASLFQEARARVKKDKYLMITLDQPDAGSIEQAVENGLNDAYELFFEKPPRGSANNFGYKAMTRLANDLESAKGKTSWQNQYAEPRQRLSAHMTAYKYSMHFWKDDSSSADRLLFADFIDEAAEVTGRNELKDIASGFRDIAKSWKDFGEALLPDSNKLCARAKTAIAARYAIFSNQGIAGLDELKNQDQVYADCLDSVGSESTLLTDLEETSVQAANILTAIRDREDELMKQLKA